MGINQVLLGQPGAGPGRGGELNLVSPAITPTVGPTELLQNAGFETAGGGGADVFANWTEAVAGTSAISDEGTIVHGGSHACKMVIDATNGNAQITQGVTSAHKWYQNTIWARADSGTPTISVSCGPANQLFTLSDAYQQCLYTQRATGANVSWFRTSAAGRTLYLDDASTQEIAFASTHTLLGTRSIRPGTYTCHPTVAVGTEAGMLIAYLDDSNFVMAIIYHQGATVYASLLSCAAGVYTANIAYTSISYTAAAELKVVVNASNYSLFYKNVQVGTTQAITDSGMGTAVHGFSTYASNTVGLVTTSPDT